ncbi:MAG: hypothetical protein WDZ79_01095 [Candidatus Paceibacterota bacterium]
MVFGRSFVFDCMKMGADFGLGIVVVGLLAILDPSLWPVLAAGLAGGVLPDVSQFAYFLAPAPFSRLQQFHEWIHSRYSIVRPTDGIFAQLLVGLAALMIWIAVVAPF